MSKHVVVLLSGGLDSSTVLAMAVKSGCRVTPVSFNYGQRHKKELDVAAELVDHYRATSRANIDSMVIVRLQIPHLRSALTDRSIDVPTNREDMSDIPVTYVPGRNSIFLSAAVGIAESIDADEVWTGFNAIDYSGYPDCRPEFVDAMGKALALGTKRGVEGTPIGVKAPIIHKTKREIVEMGVQLGLPFHLTWSCYAGDAVPCGVCDSCKIRSAAFFEAGYIDTGNVR